MHSDAADSKGVEGNSLVGAERTLSVLLLFARPDHSSWGVSEIGRELGLAKGVVHRIVATLCLKGLLEQIPSNRRYRLGAVAWALGQAYAQHIDIRGLAREPMRRLCDKSGETVSLAIRSGFTRMYVESMVPNRAITLTATIGEAVPLHAGAAAKSFLAYIAPEERDAYLSRELVAMTDQTPVEVNRLRAEVELIREQGYAVSLGERIAGVGAVAAPVLNDDGEPVVVLCVGGPLDRIRTHIDEIADLLLTETTALSRRIGNAGPESASSLG
ncbi:IclR family transcriptional regulator [Kribbella qitaiheensis]|uniref:IclR family transcriptional regulator n=1 Tax=Kribbella qitaiheensis TaxID=1544730 RepID=UPI00361B7264